MTALLCRLLVLLVLLVPVASRAQQFEFQPPPSPDHPDTPAAMRDLAVRLLPVYLEKDHERYLSNLAALQLVAGDYRAAYDTRQSLEKRRGAAGAIADRTVLYDLYARARAIETDERLAFDKAFAKAYRERVPRLSDRDAHTLKTWLATPRSVFANALQKSFDRWRSAKALPATEAVELVWDYLAFDAYRSFSPLVPALESEDRARRYLIDEDVLIRTQGGVELHARVVRPASDPAAKLPALMELRLRHDRDEAEASAARGYAGVVAWSMLKPGVQPQQIDPFRRDGEAARAVIRWITRQPWSDGRVGLYGEDYSGFTAWSAARRLPAAVKAIATWTPMAPGISFPQLGQVFQNQAYRWAVEALPPPPQKSRRGKTAVAAMASDADWYRSGRAYRDLDRRFGTPSALFGRWLEHPSFDRYWQHTIPMRGQYAALDIPILTLTGTYAEGAVGALHYAREHLRHHPGARHTLLVGPWGDAAMREGVSPVLRGYPVDAAALVDLRALRYDWFDHVLRKAARPGLLRERVNVQLTGSNQWRHAASFEALSQAQQRWYLHGAGQALHRLAPTALPDAAPVLQTVNLSDRRDASPPPLPDLILQHLPQVPHALSFASDPLTETTDVAGPLSGLLDLRLNRMDVDLRLSLYEQLASGATVQLSEPWLIRASYLRDRQFRRLLGRGVRQQIPFTSERLLSRRLAAGSRVVLVIVVNLRPDQQVNYGSGKAVNEETIRDAKPPLQIRWYGGSYIDLPVSRIP